MTSFRRFLGGSESRELWLVLCLVIGYLLAMGFGIHLQETKMRCEICDELIDHEDQWNVCEWCNLNPLCRSCSTKFTVGTLCSFCVETVHEITEEMRRVQP